MAARHMTLDLKTEKTPKDTTLPFPSYVKENLTEAVGSERSPLSQPTFRDILHPQNRVKNPSWHRLKNTALHSMEELMARAQPERNKSLTNSSVVHQVGLSVIVLCSVFGAICAMRRCLLSSPRGKLMQHFYTAEPVQGIIR